MEIVSGSCDELGCVFKLFLCIELHLYIFSVHTRNHLENKEIIFLWKKNIKEMKLTAKKIICGDTSWNHWTKIGQCV